ncbi:transcriptional regulator of acetoin/glycerol metabolism [Paracoccus pantotrophus]|uniref:Nif-specific regulatory protein n=4 Tax=Paracoccus pantotrophus TaxID=82367 RepID=A0AAE6NUQ8_PARPN|nr:sigma-54-dependent Fis family transcriptional regulator [Paracoccus pantotrophus]QFG36218.1 sigma-54-dependent Fis family transcriptional regulator [Paracoccus pantotrophus]RKS43207.1 transcriptional regulator of acetoin/glycerol metabolism [Paracoccus pantotrophus]RNI15137.1 sigma-54-dependent Fis family transcriptional regulator [Paracoccus pantotrophus]WGR66144.1 sigma-54-dependent Fis family transcriptional regulator [Paracoccus pantotrophus]
MGGMQDTGTHVLEIFRAAEGQSSRRDPDVLASWRRCVNEHRLDPTRHLGPRIVTQGELRQHRQESEELLRMARHGMEDLYRRVNSMGYVLLLANARGVTVDAIGDAQLDRELRHAGLITGSEWHERDVGTNGVGACLASGQAITVHRSDHFDVTLTPLSCTAVPIHDSRGNLLGVLDLSHLQAPQDKISQALTLEVMKSCARRIEMANLACNHRSDWILRLHPSPEFLDVDPMAAVAVGADGRITGMTHNAHELVRGDLIGRPFSDVFAHDFEDLPVLSAAQAPVEGVLEMQSGGILFARAVPPAAPPRSTAATALPAPLRAIHGGDPAMQHLAERAAKVVDRKISVILRGETGTGKEFIARAMHQSSRRRGPFVAINCAALPEALIESELFGYVPNAFTGAHARGKKGLIREAHGGTLFLDEIGDMPLPLQARLLRVLAEHEVLPVGGTRVEPVDIRVISASHRDLAAQVAEGSFRQDLFYRLNGLVLDVPPVRARRDLEWLIDRIAAATEERVGFTQAARQRLLAHDWPGNVREIINVCELCAALCEGRPVEPGDLPCHIAGPAAQPDPQSGPELLAFLERCRGNVSAAARLAGIDRSTFYRRLHRAGLMDRRQG